MTPAAARLLKRYQPIVARELEGRHRTIALPPKGTKVTLPTGRRYPRTRVVDARQRELSRRRAEILTVSIRALKAWWHSLSHRERGRARRRLLAAIRKAA